MSLKYLLPEQVDVHREVSVSDGIEMNSVVCACLSHTRYFSRSIDTHLLLGIRFCVVESWPPLAVHAWSFD